jgi:hypothetical protein
MEHQPEQAIYNLNLDPTNFHFRLWNYTVAALARAVGEQT